jgi:hypothetical protein
MTTVGSFIPDQARPYTSAFPESLEAVGRA